jgi:hypothetical protein
MNFAILESHL